MKPAGLLLLLSCLPAGSCRLSVTDAVCVSSYQDSISCSLNISNVPVECADLRLWFIDRQEPQNYSCPLLPSNQSLHANCQVRVDADYFINEDSYDIKLCCPSDCQTVMDNFQPSKNIQLTPPSLVGMRPSADTLTVNWTSGYQNDDFLGKYLKYELALYELAEGGATAQCPGQPSPPPSLPQLGVSQQPSAFPNCPKMKILKSYREAFVSLQRSDLRAGATYCIMVRSMPSKEDYKAVWSHWSQQACWRNPGDEGNKLMILTGLLAPLCVAAGLLLFAFHSPATRMKLQAIYRTPTPAPFFKPLFQQHDGNLQAWLSPPGKMAPPAGAKEVLTFSAIIVIPKPKEESQELLPPAAVATIPLTFPPSPDSYVGVPKPAGSAPTPIEPCEVNMSYTPLPCALWGLQVVGGDAVSPPPKDLLDVSRADSGCSCEDLSQSPECSLPSSPMDMAPPPPLCLNSNYCILNKTAEGVVPVLVKCEDLKVCQTSVRPASD